MLRKLTRPFIRAAKRMTGKPLAIDDISVITERPSPGGDGEYKAVRQLNDKHWKILYHATNTYVIKTDLTLSEALNYLQRSETGWAFSRAISYNHFSKVREMLPPEERAALTVQPASASPAPSPVPTAVSPVPTAVSMQTQKEVVIKAPFKLVTKPHQSY